MRFHVFQSVVMNEIAWGTTKFGAVGIGDGKTVQVSSNKSSMLLEAEVPICHKDISGTRMDERFSWCGIRSGDSHHARCCLLFWPDHEGLCGKWELFLEINALLSAISEYSL